MFALFKFKGLKSFHKAFVITYCMQAEWLCWTAMKLFKKESDMRKCRCAENKQKGISGFSVDVIKCFRLQWGGSTQTWDTIQRIWEVLHEGEKMSRSWIWIFSHYAGRLPVWLQRSPDGAAQAGLIHEGGERGAVRKCSSSHSDRIAINLVPGVSAADWWRL